MCLWMIQTSNELYTPKSPENHAKQIRRKADQCKGKMRGLKNDYLSILRS
jgi:hypothetical protein